MTSPPYPPPKTPTTTTQHTRPLPVSTLLDQTASKILPLTLLPTPEKSSPTLWYTHLLQQAETHLAHIPLTQPPRQQSQQQQHSTPPQSPNPHPTHISSRLAKRTLTFLHPLARISLHQHTAGLAASLRPFLFPLSARYPGIPRATLDFRVYDRLFPTCYTTSHIHQLARTRLSINMPPANPHQQKSDQYSPKRSSRSKQRWRRLPTDYFTWLLAPDARAFLLTLTVHALSMLTALRSACPPPTPTSQTPTTPFINATTAAATLLDSIHPNPDTETLTYSLLPETFNAFHTTTWPSLTTAITTFAQSCVDTTVAAAPPNHLTPASRNNYTIRRRVLTEDNLLSAHSLHTFLNRPREPGIHFWHRFCSLAVDTLVQTTVLHPSHVTPGVLTAHNASHHHDIAKVRITDSGNHLVSALVSFAHRVRQMVDRSMKNWKQSQHGLTVADASYNTLIPDITIDRSIDSADTIQPQQQKWTEILHRRVRHAPILERKDRKKPSPPTDQPRQLDGCFRSFDNHPPPRRSPRNLAREQDDAPSPVCDSPSSSVVWVTKSGEGDGEMLDDGGSIGDGSEVNVLTCSPATPPPPPSTPPDTHEQSPPSIPTSPVVKTVVAPPLSRRATIFFRKIREQPPFKQDERNTVRNDCEECVTPENGSGNGFVGKECEVFKCLEVAAPAEGDTKTLDESGCCRACGMPWSALLSVRDGRMVFATSRRPLPSSLPSPSPSRPPPEPEQNTEAELQCAIEVGDEYPGQDAVEQDGDSGHHVMGNGAGSGDSVEDVEGEGNGEREESGDQSDGSDARTVSSQGWHNRLVDWNGDEMECDNDENGEGNWENAGEDGDDGDDELGSHVKVCEGSSSARRHRQESNDVDHDEGGEEDDDEEDGKNEGIDNGIAYNESGASDGRGESADGWGWWIRGRGLKRGSEERRREGLCDSGVGEMDRCVRPRREFVDLI